ncbi:Protein of uncharacterised function (DUF3290) [Streptococcus pneumoniae]|nr:Protein of uncharacterised function (DUF3290) [Streptococcus pneumoniae]
MVSITTYQNNQVSNNKFQTSLHFIEVVSKDLGVDKSEVYVNTSTNTDGALIKVGDRYYRALNGSEPDKYLLEKVELYKTDALGVDKSEVYVNTSTNTDGALIKVGDRYYRALNGSEPDKYLLEKVELYKTDAIELVDVNK